MEGTEHQVARESRFDTDLRGLQVADFAHHDNVRVLAQKGPQAGRKIEPYFFPNLDLINAHEVILHRILGGRNVHIRLVEIGKSRIKRGRFAASSGPGDENHSVRFMDRVLEVFKGLRIEAELGHVQLQVGLVQKPHDDFLPKKCGKDGDPDIEFLPIAHLELDSTVLRQPPLRNIKVRHDLKSRNQGVLEPKRRVHDLMEYPVHPKPYAEDLLVRLNVDIAGATLGCIGQNSVDQRDHRSLVGGLLKFLQVDIFLVADNLHSRLAKFPQHLVVADRAKALLQDPFNRRRRGQEHSDTIASNELNFVDRCQVGRIGHRYR